MASHAPPWLPLWGSCRRRRLRGPLFAGALPLGDLCVFCWEWRSGPLPPDFAKQTSTPISRGSLLVGKHTPAGIPWLFQSKGAKGTPSPTSLSPQATERAFFAGALPLGDLGVFCWEWRSGPLPPDFAKQTSTPISRGSLLVGKYTPVGIPWLFQNKGAKGTPSPTSLALGHLSQRERQGGVSAALWLPTHPLGSPFGGAVAAGD